MIGTTVSFKDEYGYVRSGEVLTIDSDKFDDIKWDEVLSIGPRRPRVIVLSRRRTWKRYTSKLKVGSTTTLFY